jgi:hypothetical protein
MSFKIAGLKKLSITLLPAARAVGSMVAPVVRPLDVVALPEY